MSENMPVQLQGKKGIMVTYAISAILLLMCLFLCWQLVSLNNLADAKEAIIIENQELEVKIQEFKDKKVLNALNAQNMIEDIKENGIFWSETVRKIRDLVPKDLDSNPYINFYNYAGMEDGRLNLSGIANSKDDLVATLNVFKNSEIFEEVFITSISKGISQDGDIIYTFNMNMYLTK